MTKNEKAEHGAVVDYIYQCAVNDFYAECIVCTDHRIIYQIKSLDEEKLMEIVDEIVSKEG